MVLVSGVPEELGFTYGETFLNAFFEVLPLHPFRGVNEVYNAAFYPSIAGNYGVPVTMVGELYLNFWVIGVPIGFLVIGIIVRATYEQLIVQRTSFASIVIFAAITNDFLLMGNFGNSLPGTGLLLLPLCCCLYYISGGLDFEQSSISN